MGEIRAVAIAESLDAETGRTDMIQCIGTFETFTMAYGEAMIYLAEMAAGYESGCKGEKCTLSPLRDLEGETGFGIFMKNKAGQGIHSVFILHAREPESEDGGTPE